MFCMFVLCCNIDWRLLYYFIVPGSSIVLYCVGTVQYYRGYLSSFFYLRVTCCTFGITLVSFLLATSLSTGTVASYSKQYYYNKRGGQTFNTI